MTEMRCVTLYNLTKTNQVMQSSFCFERTALKYAQEEGFSSFVIAVHGRVIHSHGVSNTYNFMMGRP
jgi:hypothetical protein